MAGGNGTEISLLVVLLSPSVGIDVHKTLKRKTNKQRSSPINMPAACLKWIGASSIYALR